MVDCYHYIDYLLNLNLNHIRHKGTRSFRSSRLLVEPNRNPYLYGPGPVNRLGKKFARMPPLQGLVRCIAEATVIGCIGGYVWYVTVKEPWERGVKEYYEDLNAKK